MLTHFNLKYFNIRNNTYLIFNDFFHVNFLYHNPISITDVINLRIRRWIYSFLTTSILTFITYANLDLYTFINIHIIMNLMSWINLIIWKTRNVSLFSPDKHTRDMAQKWEINSKNDGWETEMTSAFLYIARITTRKPINSQ